MWAVICSREARLLVQLCSLLCDLEPGQSAQCVAGLPTSLRWLVLSK